MSSASFSWRQISLLYACFSYSGSLDCLNNVDDNVGGWVFFFIESVKKCFGLTRIVVSVQSPTAGLLWSSTEVIGQKCLTFQSTSGFSR